MQRAQWGGRLYRSPLKEPASWHTCSQKCWALVLTGVDLLVVRGNTQNIFDFKTATKIPRVWKLHFWGMKANYCLNIYKVVKYHDASVWTYEDMIYLNIYWIYLLFEYKHNSFKYIYEMTFTMAGSTDACKRFSDSNEKLSLKLTCMTPLGTSSPSTVISPRSSRGVILKALTGIISTPGR